MLKAKDLQTETIEELEAMKNDLEREIIAIKSELKVNRKLEKPHTMREKRHDLARVLTIITQKRNEAKE
jgi:large subunit ribosomal protein L29